MLAGFGKVAWERPVWNPLALSFAGVASKNFVPFRYSE